MHPDFPPEAPSSTPSKPTSSGKGKAAPSSTGPSLPADTSLVPLCRIQTVDDLTVPGVGTKRGYGVGKWNPNGKIHSILWNPAHQAVTMTYQAGAATETVVIPASAVAAMWVAPSKE